jgi:hypothetical protein
MCHSRVEQDRGGHVALSPLAVRASRQLSFSGPQQQLILQAINGRDEVSLSSDEVTFVDLKNAC